MKADPLPVGFILGQRVRYVVPIYQRRYAWTEKRQLARLFAQIKAKTEERIKSAPSLFAHYMGALILAPQGQFDVAGVPMQLVIDGQQRITTFQLFLAAVRDLAFDMELQTLAGQIAPYLLN